jgi:diguanylate cyclase (GGDEF)-like protein
MSVLVQHLADISGLRDRDTLHVELLRLIREALAPLSVAVVQPVGGGEHARWRVAARLDQGEERPYVEPEWMDLDRLPPLASEPDRLACLQTGQRVERYGRPCRSYFPLRDERDTFAVVELRSAAALTVDQRRLIDSLGRFYCNLRNLLDENERDALTGLLNRKTFDETIARTVFNWSCAHELAGAAPAVLSPTDEPTHSELERRDHLRRQGYWLGVIDIDHFKKVNDQFGHLIGDEVLLLVAGLMRETFRSADRIYRFGGEEFVTLVRCASEARALRAFERLRERTAAHEFPQVGHISVSIGFTELQPDDTPTDAFARADSAVYWVKQNGRNQAASQEALVRDGRLADVEKAGQVDFF